MWPGGHPGFLFSGLPSCAPVEQLPAPLPLVTETSSPAGHGDVKAGSQMLAVDLQG